MGGFKLVDADSICASAEVRIIDKPRRSSCWRPASERRLLRCSMATAIANTSITTSKAAPSDAASWLPWSMGKVLTNSQCSTRIALPHSSLSAQFWAR